MKIFFPILLVSFIGCHLATGSEFVPIFNGTDLNGWVSVRQGEPEGENAFSVNADKKAIHAYAGKVAGSEQDIDCLYTEKEYSHFVLKLEYKWLDKRFAPREHHDRDAGLLFHVHGDLTKMWPHCVEMQMGESNPGKLKERYTTGDLWVIGKDVQVLNEKEGNFYSPGANLVPVGKDWDYDKSFTPWNMENPHGEWNEMTLTVRGAQEAVYVLNGKVVNRIQNLTTMVDGKRVPLDKGRIGIQAEYAELLYRNIRIKELPEAPMLDATLNEFPQARITNGLVSALILTPDPENGFYRGTRFDWSGVIASLQYDGHEFFGRWREDLGTQETHDHIMGPVESFMANDAVIGYDEAKVGESFMRIGVGLCEKPEEEAYVWRQTYKIVDHGLWTVKQDTNWIEFIHVLEDNRGHAYRYTKRLTLVEGKPELVISHVLENTGERTISTEAFNHNFFVIDGRPSGPEFEVEFPFELTATRDLKGLLSVKDKTIQYTRVFQDDMVGTGLEGFGSGAEDNGFVITNKKTGAGVRASTDQPLHKLFFWTVRNTICPEPYIFMTVEPGEAHSWTTRYAFFH